MTFDKNIFALNNSLNDNFNLEDIYFGRQRIKLFSIDSNTILV